MALHARRVAAFDIMAGGAGFHIAARENGVLAAAEAFAETDKIWRAMRRWEWSGEASILVARVAIRTKSLLIVTRRAIGLFGAQVEGVRKNEIQIVYTLFDQRQPAVRPRPVFRNAANQAARKGF